MYTRGNWQAFSFNETALKWCRRAADGNGISHLVERRLFWSLLTKFAFWKLVRIPGHLNQQHQPDQPFSICLWQRELFSVCSHVNVANVAYAFCHGHIRFYMWLPPKSVHKTKFKTQKLAYLRKRIHLCFGSGCAVIISFNLESTLGSQSLKWPLTFLLCLCPCRTTCRFMVPQGR